MDGELKAGRTLIPDNIPSPPPLVLPSVDIIQVYVWTFFLDSFVQVTEVDLTCSRL